MHSFKLRALDTKTPAVLTATAGGIVPTPPNDKSHVLRGDGTWGHLHIFTQTADKEVTGLTETSLYGTGDGSITLPANYFDHAGKPLHTMLMGTWAKGTTASGLTLRIQMTATVSGAITTTELHEKTFNTGQLGTNRVGHFEINMMSTIRSTGATGTLMMHGMFMVLDNLDAERVGTHTEYGLFTFDTTKACTIDATAQWDTTGDAGNKITSQVAMFNP